ncbi:MAG TPA: hypothetical protein VF885_00545 [Arthrobacter sp.]
MPAATKTPARKTAAPRAAKPATARKKASTGVKPAGKARAAEPRKAAAKPPARKRPVAAKKATARKPDARTTAAGRPAASPVRRKVSRAPKPKGLEASYSGRIFRSRLEARWALLMDLLDINWDYEPSHYQVGPELYYLPDFYLPDHQLWLEVKGPAFMDAGSMAKVIASIAGPNPLPLREAPYSAADRLLIAGPIKPKTGTTALHTLVTRTPAGKAGLAYAMLSRHGIKATGPDWDTVDADGIAKARRPVPARVRALLEPEPFPGVMDSEAQLAYRLAAGAVFDDATKALARDNDPGLLRDVARRRAGRPLGPFLSATVQMAA